MVFLVDFLLLELVNAPIVHGAAISLRLSYPEWSFFIVTFLQEFWFQRQNLLGFLLHATDFRARRDG